IIVEDSPVTPDVCRLATQIISALSEPVTVGGQELQELTVSAGVGIVRRPAHDMSAADLVRAADSTMHRAKRTGRGQWGVHDPHAGAAERGRYALATMMAAAWRNGRVELRYRPLVALRPGAGDHGRIAAVTALLHWDRPQYGVAGHDECVTLAEQTGLVRSVG